MTREVDEIRPIRRGRRRRRPSRTRLATTVARSYPRASSTTSASANRRAGPATKAVGRSRRGPRCPTGRRLVRARPRAERRAHGHRPVAQRRQRRPGHAVQGAGGHDDERTLRPGDGGRERQVGERRRGIVEQSGARRARRIRALRPVEPVEGEGAHPRGAPRGRRRRRGRGATVRPSRADTAYRWPVEVGVGQRARGRRGGRARRRPRPPSWSPRRRVPGPSRQGADLPLDPQPLAVGGASLVRIGVRIGGGARSRRRSSVEPRRHGVRRRAPARAAPATPSCASPRCGAGARAAGRSSMAIRAPSSMSWAPWWAACDRDLERAERGLRRRRRRSPALTARRAAARSPACTASIAATRAEHHPVGAAPTGRVRARRRRAAHGPRRARSCSA